jgi:hypothetical protein
MSMARAGPRPEVSAEEPHPLPLRAMLFMGVSLPGSKPERREDGAIVKSCGSGDA